MRLAAVDKDAMRNVRGAISTSIRRRFLLVVVSALACVPLAHAGDGFGKVEIDHVGFSSLVYFYTTTHTSIPACNVYRKRWVLTTTTAEGRTQYAFLLAAELTGKEVRVWGAGTCNIGGGNSEDVAAVGSIVDYSQHPN